MLYVFLAGAILTLFWNIASGLFVTAVAAIAIHLFLTGYFSYMREEIDLFGAYVLVILSLLTFLYLGRGYARNAYAEYLSSLPGTYESKISDSDIDNFSSEYLGNHHDYSTRDRYFNERLYETQHSTTISFGIVKTDKKIIDSRTGEILAKITTYYGHHAGFSGTNSLFQMHADRPSPFRVPTSENNHEPEWDILIGKLWQMNDSVNVLTKEQN